MLVECFGLTTSDVLQRYYVDDCPLTEHGGYRAQAEGLGNDLTLLYDLLSQLGGDSLLASALLLWHRPTTPPVLRKSSWFVVCAELDDHPQKP